MLQIVLSLCLLGSLASAQTSCPLDSSRAVNLTNQGLTYIDESTFDTMYDCKQFVQNITSLDLSNNKITNVDVDSFAIFFELLSLNLSNNRIASLDNGTFFPLRKLESLDLSFNSLTKLEAGLISLYNLRNVWFNNNNISEVDPNIVGQENVALMYFNMNNNSMTYLDPWPYRTYQSYQRRTDREFFFEHNKISELKNYMNWTYDLKYPFEVLVHLQNNLLNTIGVETLRQYDPELDAQSVFAAFLTYQANITHNPFFCDCKLYDLTEIVRRGIFRYSRVEEYRYRCELPSSFAGIDFLHDLELDQFVCNITNNCPSGCFCQDRPHNDTFLVDCTGAGLTEMPDVIPDHSRSKLELILDGNSIGALKNTTYLPQIYNISIVGNQLNSLDKDVLSGMNATRLDFRNNRITTIPREIKKFSYSSVQLSGNPLECDCDSMWMAEWIELDSDEGDMSLTCDSKTGVRTIVDISLKALGCTNELLIIICVCLGVILALLAVAVVFAKRCPYETRVILHKLFRIRPGQKYGVDGDEQKDVDIYIVFDDMCEDVIGWVRYFLKKLNRKKPIYSVLNPARFMEPGSEAVNIPKWIGKSKRMIVVLSDKIFDNEWRCFEIEDAERRIIEAAARQNGKNTNENENNETDMDNNNDENGANNKEEREFCAINMEDENIENAPNIIYIIFNSSDLLKTKLDEDRWIERIGDRRNIRKGNPKEFDLRTKAWQEKLQQEPWKSRLAGKVVLSPDDRMFWSKLRYELPPKGNGVGDGNFTFKRETPRENPRRQHLQEQERIRNGPNETEVRQVQNNRNRKTAAETSEKARVHKTPNQKLTVNDKFLDNNRKYVPTKKKAANKGDLLNGLKIDNRMGVFTISRNEESVDKAQSQDNDSNCERNNQLLDVLQEISFSGPDARPKETRINIPETLSGKVLRDIVSKVSDNKGSPANSRPGSGVSECGDKETSKRIFTIGTRGSGQSSNISNLLGYSSNMRRNASSGTIVSNVSSNTSSSSNA
ncbi:protein toll-like [Mercenaria mercenaria]|uniref:protein toll-like n=1 Tax=Mercenaria mercenaria TaxID=6596 RepID=UPI00234F2188|nr:protein toll-like [Mercenaria mercenaria]